AQDRFVRIHYPKTFGFIHAIFGDLRGNLWVGTTKKGLHCIDIKSKEFIPHPLERFPEIMNNAVTEIVEDWNRNLWFSYPDGICRYNFIADTLVKFPLRENLSLGYNDGIVKCLFLDS